MTIQRRQFLRIAAGAATLPALSGVAWTQSYPSRPVRIISVSAAGGTNDILARLIGQYLSERLGQPFIIENRPGAGGNIAAEVVARAQPDGYTLLLLGGNAMISATFYDKLNYSLIQDITPVASISRETAVLLVNPSIPPKSVRELIAYANAKPGQLNFASGGTGSVSHLAAELFKMMTGVEMMHVPYRGGGPALTDLLSGQVQVMFPAMPASIAHIRAGTLRPLAVTSAMRLEALPEIPSLGEFVPGYEATTVFGLGAPTSTPPEIVDKLNREINAGLGDPKLRNRLSDMGSDVFPSSSSEFVKFAGAKSD
jgi:tripartite-type tricarboxylate transporter receptor subunit TctC